MSDHIDITVQGLITLPDGTVITCPVCGASQRLTVYGPVGGAATLMCPQHHRFAPPARVDAHDLLVRAVTDPRTEFLD